ncbi:hypothetical protein F5887DRAFT_476068 [Amanita rubescens]|nr:hypothetical protein F5887DRAFT_476068 [Amanita rubescens]
MTARLSSVNTTSALHSDHGTPTQRNLQNCQRNHRVILRFGWRQDCAAQIISSGSRNTGWVLQRDGKAWITLHSLMSPEAGVADKGHHPGSDVVVRPIRERYELIEEHPGLYKIKVIRQDLFMKLASHAPLTPVTVDRDGLSHELWKFII